MINKRSAMESMLQEGVVRVFVSTGYLGVVLPESLMADPVVALNFSYRFAPGDLTTDDIKVSSTLSFNGRPFWVEVPWGAVSGLMSPSIDQFIRFEVDLDEPMFKRAAGDFQPTEIAKFKLSVVPDEPGITKTYSPPRTGHLRLLKN